jgi:predicted metal-dependent phosphoesterase TrpH
LIDLHTHSTASDGSLSPADLVALAAKRGLKALALTDHDTVSGLAEAEAAALEAGIRLVRGVEIEVEWQPGEFHLLGLDLPKAAPGLDAALGFLARKREERNRSIIERMAAAGMDVAWEELAAISNSAMIGRPHIAQLLVKKRIVKNRQQAFDLYLGKGKAFYESKAAMNLYEGIDLIHKAGGLAFVAHPLSLFVSWTRLSLLFPEWKEAGADGIEAWHPTARRNECARLERMAVEQGFRVSAGSDFHGEPRPERKLGLTAGDIRIEDRFLSALDRGTAS